jgi:hypothetical protein
MSLGNCQEVAQMSGGIGNAHSTSFQEHTRDIGTFLYGCCWPVFIAGCRRVIEQRIKTHVWVPGLGIGEPCQDRRQVFSSDFNQRKRRRQLIEPRGKLTQTSHFDYSGLRFPSDCVPIGR